MVNSDDSAEQAMLQILCVPPRIPTTSQASCTLRLWQCPVRRVLWPI